MNCRPGDAAMVIRTALPGVGRIPTALLGRVCTVVALSCKEQLQVDVWLLEKPMLLAAKSEIMPDSIYVRSLPDACLMPLRDPGDHAVDQMVIRAELLGNFPK